MSQKIRSFFFAFSITFIISLIAGLSVIYFGLYNPNRLLFTKSSGVHSGSEEESKQTAVIEDEQSQDKRQFKKKIESGLENSKPAANSVASERETSAIPDSETAANVSVDTPAESALKESDKANNASDGKPDALPDSKDNSTADGAMSTDSQKPALAPAESESDSSEDNPLIKAIREASKKNPSDSKPDNSKSEPSDNPFLTLFNKQSESKE